MTDGAIGSFYPMEKALVRPVQADEVHLLVLASPSIVPGGMLSFLGLGRLIGHCVRGIGARHPLGPREMRVTRWLMTYEGTDEATSPVAHMIISWCRETRAGAYAMAWLPAAHTRTLVNMASEVFSRPFPGN